MGRANVLHVRTPPSAALSHENRRSVLRFSETETPRRSSAMSSPRPRLVFRRARGPCQLAGRSQAGGVSFKNRKSEAFRIVSVRLHVDQMSLIRLNLLGSRRSVVVWIGA